MMTKLQAAVLHTCLVSMLAVPCQARDTKLIWGDPQARIYASDDGRCALKVVPVKGQPQASGILFDLDEDTGQERELWNGKLINVPHKVLVSHHGRNVVTMGTYGDRSQQHALVIYGQKFSHGPRCGLIADLPLTALLSQAEIKKYVEASPRRLWQFDDAQFTFNSTDPALLYIKFRWGKEIAVQLTDGTVWKKPRTPQEIAVLKQTLRTGDETARMKTLVLIRRLQLKGLLAEAASVLDSIASLKVRQQAAQTLCETADIRVYDTYLKHLFSSDYIIRSEMALGLRALEQQGSHPALLTSAVPTLIKAADPEKYPRSYMAAFGTLGEIGDPRAIPIAKKIAAQELSEERRYFVGSVLKRLEEQAQKQKKA